MITRTLPNGTASDVVETVSPGHVGSCYQGAGAIACGRSTARTHLPSSSRHGTFRADSVEDPTPGKWQRRGREEPGHPRRDPAPDQPGSPNVVAVRAGRRRRNPATPPGQLQICLADRHTARTAPIHDRAPLPPTQRPTHTGFRCRSPPLEECVLVSGASRLCSEDECDRPVTARGMCRMHYLREWRSGSVTAAPLRDRGRHTCPVDHPHDLDTCWRDHGCRCDQCRHLRKMERQRRRNRMIAYGRADEVSPPQFRLKKSVRTLFSYASAAGSDLIGSPMPRRSPARSSWTSTTGRGAGRRNPARAGRAASAK